MLVNAGIERNEGYDRSLREDEDFLQPGATAPGRGIR
jgi:hypothetical protein